MKIPDECAKLLAQGNECPALPDGCCTCLQRAEAEYRQFKRHVLIVIGCFIVFNVGLLLLG